MLNVQQAEIKTGNEGIRSTGIRSTVTQINVAQWKEKLS